MSPREIPGTVSLNNPLYNGQAQPCAARFRDVLFTALYRLLLPPRASLVYSIEALKEVGKVLFLPISTTVE
jgi:hypothetical protein